MLSLAGSKSMSILCNLVDLQNTVKWGVRIVNDYGVDTAENGPSKLWVICTNLI